MFAGIVAEFVQPLVERRRELFQRVAGHDVRCVRSGLGMNAPRKPPGKRSAARWSQTGNRRKFGYFRVMRIPRQHLHVRS